MRQGKKDKVFIGGNYDNMAILRKIAECIPKGNYEYTIAYDRLKEKYGEFEPPSEEIYKEDIKLLNESEFAFFEETFPAGELFELLKAIEGEPKVLILYQTREAAKIDSPSQFTSMLPGLIDKAKKKKKEAAITWVGYHDFSMLESIIKGFLGMPFKSDISKKNILVVDLGSLEKVRPSSSDLAKFGEFAGAKIVFSGWDLKRCQKIAKEYRFKPDAIIYEGCILLRQTNGQEEKELYNKKDVNIVRLLNFLILEAVYSIQPKSVLFSQGDKGSICYYVNPSQDIEGSFEVEDLRKSPKDNEVNSRFREWIKEKVGDEEIRQTNKTCFELPDSPLIRYEIEKFNASYRTFSPYKLSLHSEEKDRIKVDFAPDPKFIPRFDSKEKEAYGKMQEIIKKAKEIAKLLFPKYQEQVKDSWDKVLPHSDGCIDILVQPKQSSWPQALKWFKEWGWYASEETFIFYITRGTKADVPFIRHCYEQRSFCAFGYNAGELESELLRAGVIPKRKLGEILKLLPKKAF